MREALAQASSERNAKKHKTELLKEQFDPQGAWDRLLGYAQSGYDAMSDEDKDFIMKSFGVFDRPATPKMFMIRLRVPGGVLSPSQAEAIGEVAHRFGRDYIDITTRMQIELRYLTIENIPEALAILEREGLTSWQTGVDNFRNIVIDPLNGVSEDGVIDVYGIMVSLQALFLKQSAWITTLPRKFNTGISGSLSNRCNVFGQDFALVLARKGSVQGFNLYLGGKVGVLAKSANIFITPDQAPALFEAVATLFKVYGFRDNRNKNRLKFLIDAVGMETFRRAIEEQMGCTLLPEGETLSPVEGGDPVGRVIQKDGKYALFAAVPSGVFTGQAMMQAAALARDVEGTIRLSVEQNLYITHVPAERLDMVLDSPFFKTYENVPSPYLANLIACAGTEHCPFGVIPNKPDAIAMSRYLAQAVPLEGTKIRMYWSACPKGCGIHGSGDLGFLGTKIVRNGKTALGVDLFIGGRLAHEAEEGKLLLKGVVLDEAKYYVETLMVMFKRNKIEGESFEGFARRLRSSYSLGAIGFAMRWNKVVGSCQDNGCLDLIPHERGVSEESDEIALVGIMLLKSYGQRKTEASLIISKMTEPDPAIRYTHFSQISADVEKLAL